MATLKTHTLQLEKDKFAASIPVLEKDRNIQVLLAFVRGSHMYGTSNDKSDVDITFVYKQPTQEILKGNYVEQLSIGGNDIVGYEIERYLQLLGQNNPNIIESLDIPEDCLIYKHESMDTVLHSQKQWLSRAVEKTILGYADSQIKKATGLNKNMNNPQPVKRKSILEFCYVVQDGNTVPFLEFFERYSYYCKIHVDYNKWGLVKMDNGKQLYALYPNLEGEFFRGLVKEDSVNLRISDIPYVTDRECYTFVYNLDGFEAHCKAWGSYKKWESERNPERFRMNQEAGQNVDLKNMMHLFRLLEMASNISLGLGVQVRSKNVEFLREIREGKHNYDTLMKEAERMFKEIKSKFISVDLPESTDKEKTKELLLKFRLS